MSLYRVIEVDLGQTLWDVAVNEYGSVEGVPLLLADNADQLKLGFDSELVAGMLLKIKTSPADKETRQVISDTKLIINTGSTPFLGEYSDDHNEDHNI